MESVGIRYKEELKRFVTIEIQEKVVDLESKIKTGRYAERYFRKARCIQQGTKEVRYSYSTQII